MTHETPVAAAAILKRIRVKKEDSAFVYSILESYEGIASYSTVDYKAGDTHRDLELSVPLAFEEDVNRLLSQLGDLIYELASTEPARSE
jgi:hypothetical protein